MTPAEYRRTPLRLLYNKKVRSLVRLRTGMIEIPAGTVLTITGKAGGFSLSTEPCPSCGVAVYIRKGEPPSTAMPNELRRADRLL